MKRNPLLPFALIAVLGVGIMFILSFQGLNKADQIAKEKENGGKTEEVAANPEDIVMTTCISCHGNELQGVGSTPALANVGSRLSEEEIKDVIVNGKGAMPGGLISNPESQTAVAQWLAEKK